MYYYTYNGSAQWYGRLAAGVNSTGEASVKRAEETTPLSPSSWTTAGPTISSQVPNALQIPSQDQIYLRLWSEETGLHHSSRPLIKQKGLTSGWILDRRTWYTTPISLHSCSLESRTNIRYYTYHLFRESTVGVNRRLQ